MKSSPAADRQQILAQLERFAALTRGCEDNLHYLREFAQDATLLPPDQPALQGHRAIEDFYARALASVASVRVTYGDPIVDLDGALAVRRYTAEATIVEKRAAPAQVMRTKYLDVLKKDAQGVWRIAVHMWSSNEDAVAADRDGD